MLCRANAGLEAIAEMRRYVAAPIALEWLTSDAFDAALRRLYEEGAGQAMQDMQDIESDLDLSTVAQELAEPKDLVESADDAPIIRLLNALVTEAVKKNASDIHMEPYEDRLVVRYRVDGVLRVVLEPKKALAPLIVSRVKVMARLDIAEKRLPQDGRISLRIAGRPVDVRVSTIPTGHGERVVMRLLDKQAGRLDLEQLGMAGDIQEAMDGAIHKPNGIILVCGPTGSGKTTTLYAVLKRLNDHSRNIMTVEDPIEYNLEGVSQTHVNTKVDMTFARGLRAILRQDPDVVMVGEMRDLETARTAVQASLTGHMVLSTLHTNSAIGAVTRLRDMGVEGYLLSSSLVAVLAQRLVRVLCESCKRPREITPFDRVTFGVGDNDPLTLYEHVGCDDCGGTGFQGRRGVYELVVVDETLRDMIHRGAGEQELGAQSKDQFRTLRADGLRLALEGVTTLEEVLRVSRED
ncbi:putative general secretory pathway protein E [Magnetofaba australis IT-1]|uniref:Type II secretion system protein E n=1 Tax=Magnetofaba australis IT-1 TaxID=1434232 RepID=A0A1Y2K6P5_9PROT|nr:putative general secretory pathway protein E [Magnetofaba australis IT-1]